ncbi:hypothetical protein ACIBK9_06900 [Nonomuraea sp. NPDC050227]|uniref:hypothetical protein n=1 Tax=Nonomuraea sp. NPDC050227 TaxID=3364360 RepID=UPI0037AA3537
MKPVLGKKKLDNLSRTDVRRLIEAKADSGLKAATVKQIHALIRNAFARRTDIDFGNGHHTVRQSLQRADASLQLVDPKTDRSRRTVPVPDPTLAALRKHRRVQAAEQLFG